MSVYCTICGEELLGAVNCCWRCGAAFTSSPGPTDVPPVRQVLIEAKLVDSESDADQAIAAPLVDGEGPLHSLAAPATAAAKLPVRPPIRRGSPFVDGYVPKHKARIIRTFRSARAQLWATPARYRQHEGATGGAVGAVVLASFSLIGLFINAISSLLTSILGIALGVWGLHSRYRRAAMLGVVLCMIALAFSGFQCAVMLYERVYGYCPFDMPSPPEYFEIDDAVGELGLLDPVPRCAALMGQRLSHKGNRETKLAPSIFFLSGLAWQKPTQFGGVLVQRGLELWRVGVSELMGEMVSKNHGIVPCRLIAWVPISQ